MKTTMKNFAMAAILMVAAMSCSKKDDPSPAKIASKTDSLFYVTEMSIVDYTVKYVYKITLDANNQVSEINSTYNYIGDNTTYLGQRTTFNWSGNVLTATSKDLNSNKLTTTAVIIRPDTTIQSITVDDQTFASHEVYAIDYTNNKPSKMTWTVDGSISGVESFNYDANGNINIVADELPNTRQVTVDNVDNVLSKVDVSILATVFKHLDHAYLISAKNINTINYANAIEGARVVTNKYQHSSDNTSSTIKRSMTGWYSGNNTGIPSMDINFSWKVVTVTK